MNFETSPVGRPAGEKRKEYLPPFSFDDLDVQPVLERGVWTCKFPEELVKYPYDQMREVAKESFDHLDDVGKAVLISLFPKNRVQEELENVAKKFSVSKQNIHQIETRAIERFCRYIRAVLEHEDSGEDISALRIEALGLSALSFNALKYFLDIRTLGDLTQKTKKELLKTKRLGKKSVAEIEAALARYNLGLKQEDFKKRWEES